MTGRRGLFWPLLLIVVGVLFLLANLGLLAPISVVGLLRLWPLLLVLMGIDIAVARRRPLAALALEGLVIVAGVAILLAQPSGGWIAFTTPGGPGETSVSAPRESADSLALHVDGGAGSYTISGGAGALVEASSDEPDLRLRTTRSGTRVDVRLDQSDRGFRLGGVGPTHVDAKVASDIPTSLDLNAGAGDFVVDLSDVKLTGARMNVGAAQLRIVLPHPTGDVPITISAGASSVVVEIPAGVEAQVTLNGALTSLTSENGRFSGSATPGYAAATDRVTVRVTGGASAVTVR